MAGVFLISTPLATINYNMTKHIVMFKLQGSDELRRDTAQRFKEALDALPEQIDVLQSIEVALNENPAEDWDIVLSAIVPTMADVATYAKHPAHVAAAAIIKDVKQLRACVDYNC